MIKLRILIPLTTVATLLVMLWVTTTPTIVHAAETLGQEYDRLEREISTSASHSFVRDAKGRQKELHELAERKRNKDKGTYACFDGANIQQVAVCKMASDVSKDDPAYPEFTALVLSENGSGLPDKQSDVWLWNWNVRASKKSPICNSSEDKSQCHRERSYGFCQININFHKEIVNDPRFLQDERWQMEQCYRLYKKGVAFYAITRAKRAVRQGRYTERRY